MGNSIVDDADESGYNNEQIKNLDLFPYRQKQSKRLTNIVSSKHEVLDSFGIMICVFTEANY